MGSNPFIRTMTSVLTAFETLQEHSSFCFRPARRKRSGRASSGGPFRRRDRVVHRFSSGAGRYRLLAKGAPGFGAFGRSGSRSGSPEGNRFPPPSGTKVLISAVEYGMLGKHQPIGLRRQPRAARNPLCASVFPSPAKFPINRRLHNFIVSFGFNFPPAHPSKI